MRDTDQDTDQGVTPMFKKMIIVVVVVRWVSLVLFIQRKYFQMTVHFQRRYGDSLNIDSYRRSSWGYLNREMSVGVEHVGRLLNYFVITVHTFTTAKMTWVWQYSHVSNLYWHLCFRWSANWALVTSSPQSEWTQGTFTYSQTASWACIKAAKLKITLNKQWIS